jgi:hypothetical protein
LAEFAFARTLYQSCLTVANVVSVEFHTRGIRKREVKRQFPPTGQTIGSTLSPA